MRGTAKIGDRVDGAFIGEQRLTARRDGLVADPRVFRRSSYVRQRTRHRIWRLSGNIVAADGFHVPLDTLLLIAYPTKALTNPMFYLKLSLIAVGLAVFVAVNKRLEQWTSAAQRWIGVALLASWGGAIVAGRLLAYTYRRLMAG